MTIEKIKEIDGAIAELVARKELISKFNQYGYIHYRPLNSNNKFCKTTSPTWYFGNWEYKFIEDKYRPYTTDELLEHLKNKTVFIEKATNRKHSISNVVAHNPNGIAWYVTISSAYSISYSAKEFLKEFTLDGHPAGILETDDSESTSNPIAEQRVNAGIEWLNKHIPEWLDKMNQYDFDVQHPDKCPLGRNGGYNYNIERFKINSPDLLGFVGGQGVSSKELNPIWIDKIRELQR
jgi:hypothetical protein